MITNDERIGRPEAPFLLMKESVMSGLFVALPCIVQSFNADAVTIEAQPAIKWRVNEDGIDKTVPLPLLVDVPVIFPRGGGATLTFPIKAGDECLVIFADRCIDYWWQSGGVQEAVDPRKHNLSDGFALVGPQSQAQKISGISTSAVQLRSDDGSTYIQLSPEDQKIKIVAPGGFDVEAPKSEFSGQVIVNGLLTFLNGITGTAKKGVAAVITGTVQFIGGLFSNGKDISDKHTHSGVKRGDDDSGGVN